MAGNDGNRRSGAGRVWTSVALAVPLVKSHRERGMEGVLEVVE